MASQARILFAATDTQGGYWYRMHTPATVLKTSGYAHTLCHNYTYDAASLKALAPDVVVFQHPTTDQEIQTVKMYRKALPHSVLVYDVDDNFAAVPDDSVHKAALPKDIKARIIIAANLCDRITVTTEPLAKVMREWTTVKDICVAPNYILNDTLQKMTSVRRSTRNANRKPRVGWAGGIGHGGDLKVVEGLISAFYDKVDFVFMGMFPDNIDPRMIELHDPVTIDQYHAKLASLDLDIALAPLADNAFNEAKSNLRMLEYGAAGFAVIASNVYPYRSFDAPKMPFDTGSWETQIRTLLANPSVIEESAEALHTLVNDDFNAEKHVEDIAKAFLPSKKSSHKPRPVAAVEHSLITITDGTSFSTARNSNPDADILWLSGDVDLDSTDIEVLTEALRRPSVASVSCFTNDGLYPAIGQFIPLHPDVVANIKDGCTDSGNENTFVIPHPVGSAVLLRAAVLNKIGVPDTTRFAARTAALLDWGARAGIVGFTNIFAPNVFTYAHAGDTTPETQEMVAAAQAWNPIFMQILSQSNHVENINFAAQNLELAFNRLQYVNPITSASYADWFAVHNTLTPQQREDMKVVFEGHSGPKISVIMPVYNAKLSELREAISSVEQQIYENWELLIVDDASTEEGVWEEIESAAARDERIKIKRRSENGHISRSSNDAIAMANGAWMVCLDHDDTLVEHALYSVAHAIQNNPDVAFIYSDADKISPDGILHEPYFTSDFNYDLLLGQNYVTHLSAYKIDAVREIDGYRVGLEGSQDWDLALRYLVHTCGFPIDRTKIHHIQRVLYHWRQSENSVSVNIAAKPYAVQAGRQAVLDHLNATKQQAAVQSHPFAPAFNMVRFLPSEPLPLASIIIQTKDNPDQLAKCINSIIENTTYSAYEILVLDNGWRKNALKSVKKNDKVRLIANPGAFNYAAANNRGAAEAKGSLLCFLNDDTQMVNPAWLNDLVAAASRPWAGAVGPRLLYPSGAVQQSGTLLDMDAVLGARAIHAFQGNSIHSPGTYGRGVLAAEWSAVTGACLVVRKEVFDEVNGFDVDEFPRDYNDVDFCLRLKKVGYFNTVLAHNIVLHHEGFTKSKDPKTFNREAILADEQKFFERHADYIDPYRNRNIAHSPNLDQIGPNPESVVDIEALREKVLIINGSHEQAIAYYQEGYVAFCATLDGHKLRMTYPRMDRVDTVDTRDGPSNLLYMCQVLGISKILLNGVGDGTYGIFGHLAEAEKYGIEVEYNYLQSEKDEKLPDPIKAYIWGTAMKVEMASAQTA